MRRFLPILLFATLPVWAQSDRQPLPAVPPSTGRDPHEDPRYDGEEGTARSLAGLQRALAPRRGGP